MGFFNFGRKKKGGWVYTGESTRSDGSKKVYVGKTTRSPYKRWGEHIRAVKNKSSTWTGQGKYFKPLGKRWSSNPSKAERTLKKYSSASWTTFPRWLCHTRYFTTIPRTDL